MTGETTTVPAPEEESVWWAPEARRLDLQPPRHRGWRAGVPQLPTAGAAASTLFVDAAKGSDSAAGTLAAPLKTIQSAVDKLATGGGSVMLRAGMFFLTESVTIAHSGITIAPYQKEEVVVSGGVVSTQAICHCLRFRDRF